MSSRPSASVATIGFPIASASNAVIGVPSQSDGNTLRSNADSVRATSRRKPANTKRSPRPERRGLRLQIGQQRPFADQKNRAAGRSATTRAAASTRYELPFDSCSRVIVPMANSPAAMPRSRAGRGDLVGASRAAELLERHAEVDDLDLRRPGSAARRRRSRPCSSRPRGRCRCTARARRSATFWNQGVSVRLACSWRMVGMRRIAPARRPNVVAP